MGVPLQVEHFGKETLAAECFHLMSVETGWDDLRESLWGHPDQIVHTAVLTRSPETQTRGLECTSLVLHQRDVLRQPMKNYFAEAMQALIVETEIASVWRELPPMVPRMTSKTALEHQGLEVANQWKRLGLLGHAQALPMPMRSEGKTAKTVGPDLVWLLALLPTHITELLSQEAREKTNCDFGLQLGRCDTDIVGTMATSLRKNNR